MNSNDHINKRWFCAALIVLPFVLFAILLFIASSISIIFPSEKIHISSNDEIVAKYKKVVHNDSLFFNQLAEAFAEINDTNHTLKYSFTNYDGGTHKLLRGHKDLSDTFPKIRAIMKDRFPYADSYFSIWYREKIVHFFLHHSLYNQNEDPIVLLYSSDRNQIIKNYPSYIIYNSDIPKEKDGWLFNFDHNWYICSDKSPRISE